ncbi:KR domain-containing protein [Aspergillus filifer]
MQGAEIYATVATPEKKDALLAMGVGIPENHVFASRAQSTPQAILNAQRYLYFLDLEILRKDHPGIIGQLMTEVRELYEQAHIEPIKHTKYHLSEIDKDLTTFAKGAHIGKFVVSYNLNVEAGIRYLPSQFTFIVDPHASSLQGIRHLLFLSRSGAAGVEAQESTSELKTSEVDDQIAQGDVEVLGDVEGAVEHSQYPIKGIVQGALSLNDGLFESMSLESFKATVGPRVTGILNLHHALKDCPFDFFEIWSLWTTLLGTTAQSKCLACIHERIRLPQAEFRSPRMLAVS